MHIAYKPPIHIASKDRKSNTIPPQLTASARLLRIQGVSSLIKLPLPSGMQNLYIHPKGIKRSTFVLSPLIGIKLRPEQCEMFIQPPTTGERLRHGI